MGGVRFYLPHYDPLNPVRPVFEDIGSELTIGGVVLHGLGQTYVLLLPDVDIPKGYEEATFGGISNEIRFASPNLNEWGEIIRQSDNPQVFVGEAGLLAKTLHRKSQYQISGEVQQRIWMLDGFACVYCGARMGDRLMTIDHFIPLEEGGVNDESNYVTACRKCNKRKGNMMPLAFLQSIAGFELGRKYLGSFERYLKNRASNHTKGIPRVAPLNS